MEPTAPTQNGSSAAHVDIADMVREMDWSVTSLGPLENWSPVLRSTVDLVLAHGLPTILLWGPDLIQIYNDGYRLLMEDRHPAGLGQPTSECWPELWDINQPIYERVFAGETLTFEDRLLPITRRGSVKDAWFTLTYNPVREEGKIAGVLVTVIETTRHHLAEAVRSESEQRQAFLLDLGDRMRAEKSRDAIIGVATRMLGEKLDASRIIFAEIDEPAGLAQIREGWIADGAESHPPTLKLRDFGGPLLEDLKAGRTVRYDDVGLPPYERSDLAALAAIGIKAGLSVPLIDGGRFVVNINVHQNRPRKWTDAEVALVEDVAERVWEALKREQAESARRISEERFRAVAETIEDVFYMTDLEHGTLLYLSPSFERVWGRPASEIEPDLSRFLDMLHPEDRSLFEANKRTQERGEAITVDYRIVRPDGVVRWIHDRSFPVSGQAGRQSAGIASDITDRKASEAALHESEERLRQFGEASQDVLWIRDVKSLQWVYLTPAFETIYGLSRDEALSGNNFSNWLDLVVPEDRELAESSMKRVKEGEQVTFDYRIRRPSDGAMRWLRNTDFPIFDAHGNVALIGGIGHDATSLRQTELRFRTLIEGVPQLVWRAVDGGKWTWSSPQWSDYTGLTREDSKGLGWLDALHPDDRASAMDFWESAERSGQLAMEGRLRNVKTGEYRWFQTRATAVRDELGEIIEWLGTSTDIHELRELQAQQQVLVAELQHRTRNLMGTVRSVADKTSRTSADLSDFQTRFRDRMQALARVQGLLSRLNEHDRVSFDELIHTELSAMNGSTEQVTLSGPRGVRLRSSTVQTLAMALHELATNAIKYGALGQPSGKLAVTWSLKPAAEDGKPWLHIDWRETGVAMPQTGSPSPGTGQGRELIERALPYQLDARTSFMLETDGVHCTISIPVSASTMEVEEHV